MKCGISLCGNQEGEPKLSAAESTESGEIINFTGGKLERTLVWSLVLICR